MIRWNKLKIYCKKILLWLHIASLFLDWLIEEAFYVAEKIGKLFFSQPFFKFIIRALKKGYFYIDPRLFQILAYFWKKWIYIRKKSDKRKWSRKIWKFSGYLAGTVEYIGKNLWRYFWSISTWKRVFVTVVIFSLVYQNVFLISGVSADESDPMESSATQEMKILAQVNPDLLKTNTFQKRKKITELSDEKASEVNYYLGLIPKTKEDRIKKREAEILMRAQKNLKGGWFSSEKSLEQTLLDYSREKDDEDQTAAKDLIQDLRGMNIFNSFTDGITGKEKEISPILEKTNEEIKTVSTPYALSMGGSYSGVTSISDMSDPQEKSQAISRDNQEVPEPEISKVNIGSSEKILIDKTPQFQEKIEMRPVGANPVQGEMIDNKVIFKDAWIGMDAIKSGSETGLKEDVIIKDPSASNILSYKIKTRGLDMRISDGRLQFFDIFGNLKFTSDKPFLMDKDGKRKDLEYVLGEGDGMNRRMLGSLNGKIENQEALNQKKDEIKDQEDQEEREWQEVNKEKNSSALTNAAQEIGAMIQRSAEWVKNIFSNEEIEEILGRKIINGKDQFDFTSSQFYQDANKNRYYTVSLKMDFSGLSYPIDLDPSIFVNLEDQGQATFYADYAEGSTYGSQGFMGGYGGEVRSSEPFFPQAGLAGYWPMDGDNVITADYSGNSNTLTNNGTTMTATGKFSWAGVFDSSTKYLSLADNASLSITGALTFGAWFKTNSVSTNQFILSKNGSYRLEIEASGKLRASLNGTSATRESSSSIDTGWHYVLAVYDPAGATLDIYLDGVLNNGTLSGTVPASITNSAGAFNIGADATANKFNGEIDEAVIWSRNLSSAEIARIYNNGRVENTDPRINYVDPDGMITSGKSGTDATALQTNSNWFFSANSSYSNGSGIYYNGGNLGDVGRPGNEKAFIEFGFTGTEVWVGFVRNFIFQRIVKTVVDEGTENEVVNYLDLYGGIAAYQQKLLIATGLSSGYHDVRIYPQNNRNISSSPLAANSYPHFDFFEYYTSGYELMKKSPITINDHETSGMDFSSLSHSVPVNYDARGNVPANASGNQEKGTWSSWIKTDFAWNIDNVPHYVWSNENARLYYLYDGSTNGNWYFEMYNGTDWTTVQAKSANYTAGNTFASGDVFHLAASWDASSGTNLYVNDVKTSYSGSWTARAMMGNMKVGGDEKTKLLLHADGVNGDARDVDASGNGYPLTFNADAKVSTVQSKFGGSSYYFDGSGDSISIPDSEDWNYGNSDFTIDAWFKSSVNPSTNCWFLGQGSGSNTNWGAYFTQSTNGQIGVSICSGSTCSVIFSGENDTDGQWHHIAGVKSSGYLYLYIDGIQKGHYDWGTSGVNNSSADFQLGGISPNAYFNGYLDEIRVSKGLARWTSNFTPMTDSYQSDLIITEPTIFNYKLTDAEVNAIYKSNVSMGDMLEGFSLSSDIVTQKNLFSAAKRSEEMNQTNKSLLFNFPGTQTADSKVGGYAGSLYRTSAPTNPSTTAEEIALTWSGNWTDNGNYRSTNDPNASAFYTTGSATEIWATFYAGSALGIAEYTVDEGTAKEIRVKIDQYASSSVDRYALIATGLENTTHTVKIRMLNNRNPSSSANGISVGLNGTANRMLYYGATPDIATQTMNVNGKTIPNVMIEDYATEPNAIRFVPKGNIPQSTYEGTISTWVQTSWAGDDNSSHVLLDTRDASAVRGILILKNASNYLYFYTYNASSGTGISLLLTASSWAANVPHHIVTKWWRPTSTTIGMALYLDGIKIAENKSQAFTPSSQSNLAIGNSPPAGGGEGWDWDGSIYDFSIWSWAFDDGWAEIGSQVAQNSEVWKSWKGQASVIEEDLSAQALGDNANFKLKHGLLQQKYSNLDYNTKLLLHAAGNDGATTSSDSSMYSHTITHNGNAKIITAQSEFGGSSYYFDGTGDYLNVPDSNDFDFGSGDFTIDFWAKDLAGNSGAVLQTAYNKWGSLIGTVSGGNLLVYMASASGSWGLLNGLSMGSAPGGTWTHYALVRNGSVFYTFRNGILIATAYSSASIYTPSGAASIGRIETGAGNVYDLSGEVDELRITKGIARWTSNFAVPTSEYSAYTQDAWADSISVKADGANFPISSVKSGTLAIINNASGIAADSVSIAVDNEDIVGNVDTSGGYLLIGQPASMRQRELVEYSAFDSETHTFTVSQRGSGGTWATAWPDNTPVEICATVTLASNPEVGKRVWIDYAYTGSEFSRDRGDVKSRLGEINMLDYTADASTGWGLSGDTSGKSGRQQVLTQVAGQTMFGYFYGAEMGYVFSGDTNNGGVSWIVVDEGTGQERKIRSDQNNSSANQFYDQLFSGLSAGYHTFRIISGVDENNSGSNEYGTFDAFISGSKSDLSLPTTGLAGSETVSGNTVNDTFYYPSWKDQDNVKNTLDPNVNLLLHADGSNGSTVSYDSSVSLNTVTHFGNAQISTGQSKFGSGSYSFDGIGGYLSIPDSNYWNFGTGDFTLDFWVNFDATSINEDQILIGQYADANNFWYFHKMSSGNELSVYCKYGGVEKCNYVTSADSISAGTWYHIALVRSGSNAYIFINGVSKSLINWVPFGNNDLGDIASPLTIGAPTGYGNYLNGYLDEVRISKGVARWTGDFSVPDKAYGGFALTSDITDTATAITLDSENPYDLNKFGPNGVIKIGSEYIHYGSRATNGKQSVFSNLIRGYGGSTASIHSNNYMVYPCGGWRNNIYAQNTSWYKENGAFPEKALIIGMGTEGQIQGGLSIINLDNDISWGKYNAGAGNIIKAAAKTVSASGGKILVGYGGGGEGISELDFVNDTYSSHGGGNDSCTKLLLHADGTGNNFVDSELTPKNITASGNVTQSTAQSNFGGSSAYFDGTSNTKLTLANSSDWNFGTNDFTIDFWVNPASIASNNLGLMGGNSSGNAGWSISWGHNDTNLSLYFNGTRYLVTPLSYFVAGQWSHVAYVRQSGIVTVYINGTAESSASIATINSAGTGLVIGGWYTDYSSLTFNGYLDEVRITNGIARWTKNFIPSVAPYGSIDKIEDVESSYVGNNYNIWVSYGDASATGTSSGIGYIYDTVSNGKLNAVYYLTSDTGYWANKLEYDTENDNLFLSQTNGVDGQDIWSKLSIPRISANSSIDSADGSARIISQPFTNDLTQDSINVYWATESGVKKVAKNSFSNVSLTFNSSNLSGLSVNSAKAVDYDFSSGKLIMGFSGASGHTGSVVMSNVNAGSPSYFDYFGETDSNSHNELVSDIFYSIACIPNLADGYDSFSVGTDQGISLVEFLESESGGEIDPSIGHPPIISPDSGILVF